MLSLKSFACILLLVLAAGITLSCGSLNPNSNNHVIQSISLSPTSADAKDYPGGKVPFVATGGYSTPPKTVTPIQANWGAASQQIWNGSIVLNPTTDVIVSTNGTAQCSANAYGTYVIGAWVAVPSSGVCNVIGGPFNETACPVLQATADLTCP